MNVRLRKGDLETGIFAIIVFCLVFSNYYINHNIPYWSTLQYYSEVIMLFVLGVLIFTGIRVNKKYKFTKTFLISLCMVFWIMIVTFFKGGSVKGCFDYFLGLIIICLYLELESINKRNIHTIFSIWIVIILLLALIDIYTELKYPLGLYRTEITIYSEYWFLGYKTERLRYTLPMVIMSIYESFFNKKSVFTMIIFLCAITSSVLSGATAASVVFLLISLVYFSMTLVSRKSKKKYPKIFSVMLNYKILIAIYLIITILIVYLQNNAIATFVSAYFQKDANFSSRGRIWSTCIALIAHSPFTGVGFFTTEQYQNLTWMLGGTNAHNMFLTILMDGGFIGLVLYIFLVFSVFRGKKKNHDYNRQMLIFLNYFIFILGIISSTIVFSAFGMLGFWILEYYDKVNMEDNV